MTRTLFVSDLDGTLLNRQSVVSERSREILNDLIVNHGTLFSIATARTPATAVKLMSGIATNIPLVVMAGAAMWDNTVKQYVYTMPIAESCVGKICDAYERHGVHPFIYRNHHGVLHAYHHTELLANEQAFINERINTPFKRFMISDNPYCEVDDAALLIYAMNRYNVLEAVSADISAAGIECHKVCYHDIFNPVNGILEVYAPGVTKAAAIDRLKSLTGADRLVVFGDNLNDREMMLAADYSVAVGNAFDEVKAIADEVIGPNTADSVALRIAAEVKQKNQ